MSSSCAPHEESARAAGLSTAAVEILVANHARFLAFLERRVGRRELAEEILQDAFVRGLSRGAGARLRDDESAVAWFYRLLRNALVDLICACVNSLLDTLEPAHARALRSVELGETSVRELAAREGITPGHASVRLHRARQALRRRVEQSCGTCDEHGCYECECRSEPHGPRPARPAA